ncbi:hypothetical protein HYPSUDRAFT_965998 [Hypholoma sublateritium FD-334 SS-4]|uniref:F-box domain-containing protein n=1 Tax=Hypholoma sublateritium (strain FD-334 SS-4) TaxID=945553 RepID=A0A0D2M4Y8_HYPSF|nr:hypothetical protein HYPSUDRAFT_965998 [Hypholoma sublateritium FD-334 SS-4]
MSTYPPSPQCGRDMMSFTLAGCRAPLEIIALIVQHLANERDIASLKACACACWDFVDICHHHIFNTIELSDSSANCSKPSRTRRYKKLFQKSPWIANNVRTVKYINDLDFDGTVPVLRFLRRVHTFSFGFANSDVFAGDQYNWNAMLPKLQQSFCYFIQSNNIVNLHLRSILDVPVGIFAHLPYLTDLDLVNVTISQAPPPIHFRKPESNICLRSLMVHDSWTAINSLLKTSHTGICPLVDLRGMEDLVIIDYYYSLEATGNILASSDYLASVEIRGAEIDFLGHIARNINPSSRRRLKKITLVAELQGRDDPYKHFTHELDQMAGDNVLEEIELQLSIETNDVCNTEVRRWAQLDNVCSQHGAYPYLRRVQISVTTFSCGRDYTALHSTLRADIGINGFLQLRSNNRVEFSFNVTGKEM